MTFPSDLPGLKRGALRNFDESGANSSVAYHGTGFPLEITIFIYPQVLLAGASVADHFRAAVADIYHFHPQARLERSAAVNLPFANDEISGFSAFLTFVDSGKDCGSWVWIIPVDTNIVKVRATYERGDEEGDDAGSRLRDSHNQMTAVLRLLHRAPAEQADSNEPLMRRRGARRA